MRDNIVRGATSVITSVKLYHKLSGDPLTLLDYTKVVIKYFRQGIDTTYQSITLTGTGSIGTWTGGGGTYLFKEKDATNAPGVYELHLPNAMFSSASREVELSITDVGSNNIAPWFDVFYMPVQDWQASTVAITTTQEDAIVDKVWDEALSGHTTAGTAGKKLGDIPTTTYTIPAASDNADAVWNRLTSAITTAGSIGKKLVDMGVGSDGRVKITADAHTAGATVAAVVGNVGGNVNGNVVGSVDSVTGNVGGNVVGSVASVAAPVTVGTNNDKTGYALSAGGVTAVQSGLATVANQTTIISDVSAIKAKTDNLPASPAAVGDIPTTGAIADAVWDEARAGHTTAGTFGEGVTSVQGDVGGNVIGNLNGHVAGDVQGDVLGTVSGVAGNVTGSVNSVVSDVSVDNASIDAIFLAVMTNPVSTVEGSATGICLLWLIALALHQSAISGGQINVKNDAGSANLFHTPITQGDEDPITGKSKAVSG